MDFFVLKKVLGAFLMPLPLTFICLIVAWFFVIRKSQRASLIFFGIATLLLALSTLPFLPEALLRKTEQQYVQYDPGVPVQYIVILGGGHVVDATVPLSSQLNRSSTVRVVEAARIYYQNPGSKIVTSGGVGYEPYSTAEMHKRLLVALGIPESDIIIGNSTARDTEDEANLLSQLLSDQYFILVTSASHMQRSMTLFEAQGLTPIPAPTGHLVKYSENSKPWWQKAPPASRHLLKMEMWWYETLGRSWQTIKSWFA